MSGLQRLTAASHTHGLGTIAVVRLGNAFGARDRREQRAWAEYDPKGPPGHNVSVRLNDYHLAMPILSNPWTNTKVVSASLGATQAASAA